MKVAPWGETKVVGKALPRVDAYERVSGTAVYPIDIHFPDMLYAAILRCPHAHAQVRRVDTSKAEKMPGVRGVITGKTPGADVPWYPGPKGPTSHLFDPHCRYAGEEVAAVAADSPDLAAEALRAIQVDYEELPFVVDPEEARKPGASAVQDGGNVTLLPVAERGDLAKGFAEADVVLEASYQTGCQIHATAEPHGCVVRWEGNRFTAWISTQGVFDQQEGLAAALRLDKSSVRVICTYMGGGFGSKLDLSKESVIAALLARQTARPVKLFLTREEEFLCVGNRPSDIMTIKAGVKRDGTLTALHFTNFGVVGAYPGDAEAGFQVMDLYHCPNARADESAVHIHAGKDRAFRAPGFPQCNWALEQTIDQLAEKIGMDPIEFRLKNLTAVSQTFGKPYTSTGLEECLVEGARAFGWAEARKQPRSSGPIRRGVGVAAGIWGYAGDPRAVVILKLNSDGTANLNMGASDIGTGTKTVMSMVAAEELGVSLDQIEVEYADTATTQYAPPSGGSQTVLVSAPAIRSAAAEIRRQLFEIAAEELKQPADALALGDGRVYVASDPEKGMAIAKLKGLDQQRVLVGVGRREPHPADKIPLPFVAQFAEVEVNTLTGQVKVLRMLAAQDSGRVMNPLTYENQVFGGVTMGIGFGLFEQRRIDRQTGRVLNVNLHDYKVPTALEVPGQLTCLPIDPHDRECNTVGSKGLGEPAMIPTATAVANAIYHASGVRPMTSPATPMQMLALLAEQRKAR